MKRSRLPVLAALLLFTGCLSSAGLTGGAVAGSATLGGSSTENRTLTPALCRSGERQLFLGADFESREGTTTRLILDPSGIASLRLFDAAHPLDRGMLFHRADCSLFKLSFDQTGWRINDIRDLSIRIGFDCRTASGEHAEGTLSADHCH